MNNSLTHNARAFFNMGLGTPEGSRLLNKISWKRIVKFIVDDEPLFYMDVEPGKLEIVDGDSKNNNFWDVSRVHIDSETFELILAGKKDSVDAQYEDEAIKVLPSGEYTQITFVHQLCRLGRERILEEVVREFEERVPDESR